MCVHNVRSVRSVHLGCPFAMPHSRWPFAIAVRNPLFAMAWLTMVRSVRSGCPFAMPRSRWPFAMAVRDGRSRSPIRDGLANYGTAPFRRLQPRLLCLRRPPRGPQLRPPRLPPSLLPLPSSPRTVMMRMAMRRSALRVGKITSRSEDFGGIWR